MSERWLTLLNDLTRRLLDEPYLLDDPRQIMEEFIVDGFQQGEVENALAWIGRFIAGPDFIPSGRPAGFTSRGFRTRSAEEQISFAPEAFGYLLRMENSGLIDPTQREEIMERALESFDEEIGEEEIKLVSRLVLQDHGLAAARFDADPLDLIEQPRSRNRH